MTPVVSIIVISYNVRDLLKECLKSIYQSNPTTSFEIIVVDNASTQPGIEKIYKQFSDVSWIQNKENKGFAAANNQAILTARGEFLWLLNPDTLIYPGSMDTLVEAMRINEQMGAAGSLLESANGDMQLSCYPFPTLWREFVRLFHLERVFPVSRYQMHKWEKTVPHLVDNIQGASLMVRKSALDQIGLFDEDFFMYTEEVDLNYRLQKNGWLRAWVPSSRVLHYGAESTRQARTAMFLQLYQTKILFFRKHYGHLSANIYKFILSMAALFRVVVAYFTKGFHKSAGSQTMFENYWQLLRHLPSY